MCVVPMWMAEEDPSAPRAVVQGTPGVAASQGGCGEVRAVSCQAGAPREGQQASAALLHFPSRPRGRWGEESPHPTSTSISVSGG